MLVDLAALCRARPTGNSSERNQTNEDELGISSGLLTLAVLLQRSDIRSAHSAIRYPHVVMFAFAAAL